MLITAALLIPVFSEGQSIRKDYREMTEEEEEAYVDALFELWDEGIIEDFGELHHQNMSVPHEDERFLPWHRIFIQKFEEELQNIEPMLAIPYWDWADDNDTTAAGFWSTSFLDTFDGEWNLGRCLNCSGSLPDQNDIDDVMALTNFRSGGNTTYGFGGGNAPGGSSRGVYLSTGCR
ncbi:MAG: tyrosinase family protein [Balneolales bacterium]